MSNNLESRQVEKKAIRRWTVQALDLLGRGFWMWCLFTTIGCLLINCCSHLGPLVPLLETFIEYLSYACSVSIAMAYDQSQKPSLRQLVQWFSLHAANACKIALVPTLLVAGMLLFTYTVAMLGYLVDLYHPQSSPPLPPLSGDSWADALFQLGKPFLSSIVAIAFVLPIFSFAQIPSLFAIPASLSFGITANFDILSALLDMDGGLARGKNTRSVRLLHALHIVLPVLAALLSLAFLAPVLLAFLSAITYVAYRDIYLGKGENVRLEAKAASLCFTQATEAGCS
jgi:hypothetical protein